MKDLATESRGNHFFLWDVRHFPWLITALATILLAIGNVQTYTFGVFFKPVATQFNWSRSAVSVAFSLRMLVMVGMAVASGYLSERYGPRKVLLGCVAVLGASLLLTARITSLWQWYVIQGLFMGLITPLPFICLLSLVSKWHVLRRGLALGIAASGVALSSVVFPPLATHLIESLGWHNATIVLGLIVLAAGIPCALVMRTPSKERDSPNLPHVKQTTTLSMSQVPRILTSDWAVPILMVVFLLSFAPINMTTSHFVNYATDVGASAAVAASMLSVMGVAGVAGRLFIGAVSDRIGSRASLLLCLGPLAASMLLLTWNPPLSVIWVSVVLFGIGNGGPIPLIPVLAGGYSGAENMALMSGVLVASMNIGGAIGPWVGGFVFDISGSYVEAFAISGALSLLALLLAALLPAVARRKAASGSLS